MSMTLIALVGGIWVLLSATVLISICILSSRLSRREEKNSMKKENNDDIS